MKRLHYEHQWYHNYTLFDINKIFGTEVAKPSLPAPITAACLAKSLSPELRRMKCVKYNRILEQRKEHCINLFVKRILCHTLINVHEESKISDCLSYLSMNGSESFAISGQSFGTPGADTRHSDITFTCCCTILECWNSSLELLPLWRNFHL